MGRNPSCLADPFLLAEVTMPQHVTPQALVESFTILPSDRELLGTKSGASRLGGAVLLKYFQCEGRFPATWHDVPREVRRHLAQSVGVSPETYRHSDLDERLARYHKEQIRQGTGVRQGHTTDAEAITAWGCAHSRVEETTIPVLIDRLTARSKQLQSERLTPGRLERLAHLAAQTVAEQFLARLADALAPDTRHRIDAMLTDMATPGSLSARKIDTGRRSLNSLEGDVEKLHQVQRLALPQDLLVPLSTRSLRRMKLRGAAESLSATRRPPDPIRYGLVTLFCYARTQEITDRLVELLLQIGRQMGVNAEKRVDEALLADVKRVTGKTGLLFQMAEAALDHPKGQVDEVIYPVVGAQPLRALVKEARATGRSYRAKVHPVMRGSYSHHDRRMVPQLLSVLAFPSNNAQHQPVMQALDLVQTYTTSKRQFYGEEEVVPVAGVVPKEWQETVLEPAATGQPRGNRLNYEMHTLQALRERVRCQEIWVPGAQRSRNPADDLPADFADQRTLSSQALHKPLEPDPFSAGLQRQRQQALQRLDRGMPHNPGVKILQRPQGWIRGAKMARQPDPPHLAGLKAESTRRWPLTGLLDVLKATEWRVGFTQHFTGTGIRAALDDATRPWRLLLCLFGLGSKAGLKRVGATPPGAQYHDLLYVRRRYLHPDAVRNAIAEVGNAICRIRAAHSWGEGTTACASDAQQCGAWDQNLLTEWHMRYGGREVMLYWHVEQHATCIYSQRKTCSSSEVACMLEGLLRHGTEMEVEQNYVDSGGPSEVGFAFCHLLGLQLLPRLTGIHRQKLYRPLAGHPDASPHLQTILGRPMRWDLIRQQDEQMLK
jgi:hypothetical protein